MRRQGRCGSDGKGITHEECAEGGFNENDRNTSSPKIQHTLFLDVITHRIQQKNKGREFQIVGSPWFDQNPH